MEGKSQFKRGLWTGEEDKILMDYIRVHGKGRWNRVAKMTGLKRCGKSCRLRWINYLSPSVKKGDFTEEEEDLVIRLHKLLGNRWSLIAGRVPGRTDNQVKNHWNTHLCKKLGIKKNQNKRSKNDAVNLSQDSNLKLPYCDTTNDGAMGVVANEISQVVAESSNTPSGEYLEGSCWFSNTDLSVNQWSLMELTDVWPLELLWNDL